MVTLTYQPGVQWEPKHLSAFISAAKNYLQRRGATLRYVWVAELQQRGAVHFHVLVWLPRGVTLPKPDKRGWWPHGSTRIEWARNPVGYLCKYASKLDQKGAGFPKGLRLHGVGGLDKPDQVRRSHHLLPKWIRDETCPELRIVRRPGGGFFSRVTGEVWESPWRIDSILVRLGVGPLIYVSRYE